MGRFFDSDVQPEPREIVFDTPRAIVGSVERLNLSRNLNERIDKRPVEEWQRAAWRFFDAISEIHSAFELIGQICSRVRLFPAIVLDPEREPVHIDKWLEEIEEAGDADQMKKVADKAKELLADLVDNTPGRTSGLMRTMAINLSVPGEAYLAHDAAKKKWMVLSNEEITPNGRRWRITRSRTGNVRGQDPKANELDSNAFVARIWRAHPRFGDEADSSMIGVLDECEQLSLLDQVMRAMARRAMNAGLVFIPTGITAFQAETDEDETLAESIARSALAAAERETAISTVTPKVVGGPPELGDKIKRIVLSDVIDEKISLAADRLLERILVGLDAPKDILKGLANVKYSNAVVIDENMFSAHIEPLVLLIVDSLTQVYLQPLLSKDMSEANKKMASKMVIWADTSAIVTRPDSSQAANEGYEKKLLSGEAWRRTRGFNELDKPDDTELLARMVIERAQLAPEQAAALIERLDPEFFNATRTGNQEAAGFPDDISQLLNGSEAPDGQAPLTPDGADDIIPDGEPAPVPTR